MSESQSVSWVWPAWLSVLGVGAAMLKWYARGRIFTEQTDLSGKVIIVTGASCGIGQATAIELAKKGATVILACRDKGRASEASQNIRRETSKGVLIIKSLDLASFQSVHRFAEEILSEFQAIDVLINNAAVFQCPYQETENGFEMQIGVNHLGHFLLTNLLLDRIKTSAGRIVIVSSGLHKYGKLDLEYLKSPSERLYDRAQMYKDSKLANNFFARHLDRLLRGSGVGVFCLRPGIVRTNLGRHKPLPWYLKILYPLAYLLTKTPYEGCQTVVYCACSAQLQGKSGGYYANCELAEWSKVSLDDDKAARLWDISLELTGLK